MPPPDDVPRGGSPSLWDPVPRLAGRVAVVVGGGQTAGSTIGNGRATAVLFAHHGARVLVGDVDVDSAEETVDLIRAGDGEAQAVRVDITVEEDVVAMFDQAQRSFGGVDVLVNNVGTARGDAGATSLPGEVWDHLVAVNLKGPWLACKHGLPVMRRKGSGVIVNVSSIAAVTDLNMVAYKAAKAGLNALTRQLALTNARFGIRVNAVMPGLIDTPVAMEGLAAALGKSRGELAAERSAAVPLGRMGTAWDVAAASLFLASDEAAFVTGVVLPVDGGQSGRVG